MSSIERLYVARVSRRDGAATRADGAVERKAKDARGTADHRLACLPSVLMWCTRQKVRQREGKSERRERRGRLYMHMLKKKRAKSIP